MTLGATRLKEEQNYPSLPKTSLTDKRKVEKPVEIPVTGTLDLHGFQPRDIKELVPVYLEECQNNGIFEGIIIHGKGIGTLRDIVHSILRKNSKVISFRLGANDNGGWGSTSFVLCEKS